MTSLRLLYLHGFASGPRSAKGVALAAHFAQQGRTLEPLDLRLPSLEHLRFSAMLAHVLSLLDDRTILFGSSLGGLTAARVAEKDPRVIALVLLAPAFLGATRWRTRMGEAEWQKWQQTGWMEIDDYAEKRKSRVDFAFAQDLAIHDTGWPEVSVPTLIIHGVQDDVVDVALSRQWSQGRQNVKLVEVQDGHELVQSLPKIAEEADAFLEPLFK